MASLGAQQKLTTRCITSGAKETGATAPPLAAAQVMGEGGAPGDHGAPVLSHVEEARGAVQGAALVEAAQDQPRRLSGVTGRAAVIVAHGVHGAVAKADVEGREVRAGAEPAEGETVKESRAARAQPRAAPRDAETVSR